MKKNNDGKNNFIGRKSELDSFRTVYDKFLKEEDTENNVILIMYSGDGGIGKSSLISRLEKEIDDRNKSGKYRNYVHIDCNQMENDISAMVNLVSKLNEECGIKLQKFMNKLNDYLIACGKIDSSEMSATISGLASKLADEFAGSRMGMAVEGVSWIIKTIKKNAIKSEYGDDTDKIAEELPKILAEELSDNLRKNNRHLVIFLDTFELLKNNGYDTDWLDGNDGIIKNLKNTMWVLGGREEPDSTKYRNLMLKQLPPFTKEEGMAFLENQGISGDAAENLWSLSDGIPNHLQVLSDSYNMQMKVNGEVNFDELKGNVNEILERRYTLYLNDEQKNAVKILACLGSWTDDLLNSMFLDKDNRINFDFNEYEKIKEFTFIENNNGIYSLSKSMRDILLCKINDVYKKKLHELAYQSARVLLTDIKFIDEQYSVVRRIMLEQFKLSFGDDIEAMEKALYNNKSDVTMWFNESIIEAENKIQELEQNRSSHMQEYFDEILKKQMYESWFLYDDDIINYIDKYWQVAEEQTELPKDSLVVLSFKAKLLSNGFNLTYSLKEKYNELYEQVNNSQQKYKDSEEYNMLRANVMLNRIRSLKFSPNDDKDKKEADIAIKEFINWWVFDCPVYSDDETYSKDDKEAADYLSSYLDCFYDKTDETAEKTALADKLSAITQIDRCPLTLNAARNMRPKVYSDYSSKIRDVASARRSYEVSAESYGDESQEANHELYTLLRRLWAEDSPNYNELQELAAKYALTETQNANKREKPIDQYNLLNVAEIIVDCCENLGDFTPALTPLYRIYMYLKFDAKPDDDADSKKSYYKKISQIAQLLSKVYNKLQRKETSVDVLVDMYDVVSVKCGEVFNESEMYCDLAVACHKAGLYDRGEGYIGKVGLWDKSCMNALNIKARLYSKNGKTEQAVKIAEENLNNAKNGMYGKVSDTNLAVLTLMLAMCCCMAGNKQRSQELVSSQIIESNKDNERVKQSLHTVEELLAQQ